jgi:uncharacterized protein (DUF362 family)
MAMNTDVCVVHTSSSYGASHQASPNGKCAVDALLAAWGRDPRNPFADWLGPGGRVVIKPNWVNHDDPNAATLDALVTHSSVVERVLEHAATAMDGRGTVIIGDAPIQGCDFPALIARTGIQRVVDDVRRKHPKLEIAIEDWRLTVLASNGGNQTRAIDSTRASDGFRLVDLGRASFLEDIAEFADRFRVTCYAPEMMAAHHRPGKHEYLVTSRIFGADLVVNLPKMKTHIKAGLTGALKNLVGINGHKEYLPHHILGASEQGGDCYYRRHPLRDMYDSAYDRFWATYDHLPQRRRRLAARALSALWRVSEVFTGDSTATGSWPGNETVWRMTLDLNHVLYFADDAPRRVITIVDGIVAGEGEGPLRPTAKPVGLLIGGENPAYIDGVLASLMGYNVSRIPTVYHAIYHRKSKFGGPDLQDVGITWSDKAGIRQVPFSELPDFDFQKPPHWGRAQTRSSARSSEYVVEQPA